MEAASAYIAFTVVISRVWLAESCGGLTHIEIAHQAAVYFEGSSSTVNYKKLIEKHDVAFQAGAPYPDAFYSGLCYGGKFHDISEDTHWVPFMNATINYIHRHYPQPWDESTEKLVAFLFGLVSHQVADVSWHSLGIKQGFLSTMAKLNFHDNYDVAHSVGDFGGDVFNRFALKLDYITKEWYIPVDDLVNIYRDLYGGERISAEIIRGCTALLFITRIAEIAAVGKFYPVVAGESPFLLDMLNSYFLGGMNDMAVWTDITWRKTIYMLEHGTRSCQWKHNPLFINCSRSGDSRSYSPSVGGAEKRVRNGYFIQANLGEYRVSDVHIRRAGRGVILSPAPHIQKFVKTVNKLRRKRRAESAGGTVYPVHKIGSSKACGRFGWDLKTADVNKDGHLDLIVGAPGYGRAGSAQMGAVFVILGTSDGIPHINLDGNDIITIYGPEKHGSFGQAVVILDVNKDGIQDLVVSAPAVPFTGIKEIPAVQYAVKISFGKSWEV